MTYKEREEIFSKESLNIKDIMVLYDKVYSTAAQMIQNWKIKAKFQNGKLRLDMDGSIHILDYFDVMGIDANSPGYRYFPNQRKTSTTQLSVERSARKSVCAR